MSAVNRLNVLKENETKMNQYLRSLYLKNIIEQPLYYRLRSTSTSLSVMYDQPKVHRNGYPLRPIISSVGSYNYELSRHLAQIIQRYRTPPPSFVKDSFQLVERIKNIDYEDGQIMICETCEQGLRSFTTNSSQDNLLEYDTEDQSSEQINNQNMSDKRKDIYVRVDGQLLFDKQASDERKKSIARRKALDLRKLLQNSACQSNAKNDTSMSSSLNCSDNSYHSESAAINQKNLGNRSRAVFVSAKANPSSEFTTNIKKISAVGASATAFASKSKGHANALNVHAKGVNASASATADRLTASALNANATGLNASASASATAVRVSTLNTNVTAANVSVSATADGLSVATGNVGVTGVDVAASTSVSAAKVQVGNIDVNGASAGASMKVNGGGVTAGNIAIGGPSAAISVNIDGSLSFGNINIGLRPSLDIGLGLNLGIPFLSGTKMGSQGNAGANNSQQVDGQGQNTGALQKAQDYLSSRFPNKRTYKTPVDVSIQRNKDGQEIDPLLPDTAGEQADVDGSAVNDAIQRHNQLVAEGMKFAGFKGCPPPSSTTNLSSTHTSSSDPAWEGMYTSPSPDVAAGYVGSDDGQRVGDIKRVYVPNDAGDLYYTKTGLETPEARVAVEKVKEHSGGKYMFSGPQDSKNPDLFPPELVISPSVRDEAKANGNLKFEASAHVVEPESRRIEQYHQSELEHSKMIPDYLVNIKTAVDCAKTGGRERLAHVFQGQPPSGCYNNPTPEPSVQSKQPEMSEEDKLLLEECAKVGVHLTSVELDHWKKKLKSDAEYERDEDLSTNGNTNMNTSHQNETSKTKDDEELVTEPPKPCKNHAANVRCMKCTQNSSGLRIRQVHNNIHGFNFKD
ncbi:unnamed protein product [Didymodactylos carnosus]|uniref:Exotoxin A catalytic domain-containing protein n=1 Tax=Didymodactylos carnosus TaxID=1234261 RepID=A0A8S2K8T0_9BILA|nr:unnamed protein product [Didymodactylos carnosus]CAF3841143.1 unnamed protein product [Didymodactylos carnosus]